MYPRLPILFIHFRLPKNTPDLGFSISRLPALTNFSTEEQVARLPQSTWSLVYWKRDDRMSISLLTACHCQESNKQLHKAKLNSFQIQMGSLHLGCPTKGIQRF